MKILNAPLIIIVLLAIACQPNKNSDTNAPGQTRTILKPFSDSVAVDTFKIELSGKRVKDMKLVFTITPASGKIIYSRVLKATTLIDNYKESVDLGREKKQIKFMEDELALFLDEENFMEPAVMPDEVADKNTPDKKFFEELKISGLNGFKYRTGKESNVYIAWSEASQQVKPYFQCCK